MNELKVYPDNLVTDIIGEDTNIKSLKQYIALNKILSSLSENEALIIRLVYELNQPIDKVATSFEIDETGVLTYLKQIVEKLSTDENKKLLLKGADIDKGLINKKSEEKVVSEKSDYPRKMHTKLFMYRDYPNNLIYTILDTDNIDIDNDNVDGLLYLMNTHLSERDRKVILNKFQDRTKNDILGKEFDITGERVYQIISKFIRLCRRPGNIRYITQGYNTVINEIDKIRCEDPSNLSIYDVGFDENLTRRLKYLGFNTIGDIVDFIRDYNKKRNLNMDMILEFGDSAPEWYQSHRFRNIGKKTATQIADVINDLGIEI